MDHNAKRRKARAVSLGSIEIGGGAPISVQSMTNTDTHDIDATFLQVSSLAAAGCDIVRISVPDIECSNIFKELRSRGVNIPLVADIHFDHRIAIAAAKAGASKLRINPGNIGSAANVREVVSAAKEYSVPIRIGVNSGSVEKHLLEKYSENPAEALAESALYHASLLEKEGFYNTVLSVKSSSVPVMIEANRILAEKTDYPLHLGVTEAGAGDSAIVKSSIGIGALLSEGIGDTVRVSLTEDPVNEISAARRILSALSLSDSPEMEIISCPTCARTNIDLISLVKAFESAARSSGVDKLPIKVALMGCAVNGPGEARDADIGIAGGRGEALLFKAGKPVRKIREENIICELISEIKEMVNE